MNQKYDDTNSSIHVCHSPELSPIPKFSIRKRNGFNPNESMISCGRPTRTPRPTTNHSFNKSLFLDRTFCRKELLFEEEEDHVRYDDNNDRSSIITTECCSLISNINNEYNSDRNASDENDDSDSEYDYECYLNEEKCNQEDSQYFSMISNATNTITNNDDFNDDDQCDLTAQIENLSIIANINTNTNKTKPLISVGDLSLNIVRKNEKEINENKQSKTLKKTNKKSKKKVKKVKGKSVRVTRSKKVFDKNHSFFELLMDPSECGSGCPLYKSIWKKKQETVTKMMPLFENAEFTKKENIDNAVREFEFHCDVHRKASKMFGIEASPCVAILACVDIQFRFEATNATKQSKTVKQSKRKSAKQPYLAIVMPRLQCNLAQFLEKHGKLSEKECLLLLQTGIEFLTILDDLDIVHNDIKPENIFICFNLKKDGETKNNERISKFVFGDFGCSASTSEEFPFGALTGTLTMWDLESLGESYGKEDGFCKENDLYGVLGSLFDAIYGESIVEKMLHLRDPKWSDADWEEFTDLMRNDIRKHIQTNEFMERRLHKLKCKNQIICTALKQIGKDRKERMTLKQFQKLIETI